MYRETLPKASDKLNKQVENKVLRKEPRDLNKGNATHNDCLLSKKTIVPQANIISNNWGFPEVLVVVTDVQGRIKNFNQACERLSGYTCKQVCDRHWWDLSIMPPEEAEDLKEVFARIKTSNSFTQNKNYWIAKDKSRHLIFWSYTAIAEKKGIPEYVIAAGIDLAELTQLEMALQAKEEKYTNLFHYCNDAIILHDLEGNILDVNQKAIEQLGYTKAELLSLKLVQVHPQEDSLKLKEELRKIIQNRFVNFEMNFQTRKGKSFPAEVSSSLFEIKNRYFILAIIRNISNRKQRENSLKRLNEQLELRAERRTIELIQTNRKLQREIIERRKIEENLRNSEEKYRSVVNNLEEVVFQIDKNGLWTFLNPAWTKITGFSVEESLGTHFLNYIHPDDRQLSCEYQEFLMQGKIDYSRYEIRYLKKEGGFCWVEVLARLILDVRGNIISTSGTLNDITKRKQVEEELVKTIAKERELGELKSRFVSMTSHEFLTPLAIISSSAGLLKEYGHKLTQEKKDKHLDRIQSSIQHMSDLLNDILMLNQVEANKLEFNPQPLNVIKFCQDLVDEIQLSATEYEINFLATSELDNIGESGKVDLDKKLLRHILSNLLCNAIKYSAKGSTIDFYLTRQNQDIVFQIKDQGIGIAPEDRERLFESFHRGKNVGNIPGSGLGLAIVKNCVDLHKGKITFTSKSDEGTIFIVKIPVENID